MSQALHDEPRVQSLDAVVRGIDEISTLPQVALRIIEVANDENSGAYELKEVMESDTALSARVLRCVNSSAYATRTTISNLQQAIAYLGMKQIRNLALTVSVSELFKSEEKIGTYCRSELWRHLVSVGICSRLIATRRKIANFEDAFLAGLLHDIGIVLEDQYVHRGFETVITSLDKSKTLMEVERANLKFDHTLLGEQVGKNWGFPEIATAAIRYHHMSVNYRGPSIDIVRCVEVANLLCTLKDITSVGMKLIRISQPALTGLSLTKDDLIVLASDLDHELQQNANLFQV